MIDVLPTARTTPFDPPPELLDDPRPLRRITFTDGHLGWLVTSYDLARSVLGDQRFSAAYENARKLVPGADAAGFGDGKSAPPGFLILMDPPDHTRLRKLLTGQFTVRRMKALEPRIEQIVTDHLDAIEQTGAPVDLVSEFALPIPSLVICELLGVPYEERDNFQRNSAILLRLGVTEEEAGGAISSLMGYISGLIERKRAEPAEDLLSGLIAGGELTHEELVGIAIVLLIAGHETTANMLALGTFALLSHPEQLGALREGRADPANAVEELLRYLTIIQHGITRTALEDVELAGETIRAGESIGVHLPMANRDTARFAGAHELELTADARGHLTFSHGIHQCLGQQLARLEMRIAYVALLRRFPTLRLAVPPEEVPLRTDMAAWGVHRLPVEW
jgi:cytochrome P450